MLRLAVLAVAFVACLAAPELKDCHPSGNSAVRISNPVITPYPPVIPGPVKISLDVEILRPLNNFDTNVTLIKDLDGFPLRIPCLEETIGSCYYENTCASLEATFPDGQCPPVVTQCRCPFKANKLEVRNLEINLPQLPAEIAPAIPGSYELYLSLHDSTSRAVLSCLNLKLEIRGGRVYLL